MSKKQLQNNKIAIFEGDTIRKVSIDGEWHFSVIDVIAILSESSNPRRYWSDLKRKLTDNEGFDKLYENIVQLKLMSTDGKKYLTDVADTQTMLRVIQSIPSKKAEPFKRWLARVGKERLDEIEQPEKAIERGRGYYAAKGYSQQWIETRTASIDTRHKFTDTLKESGIKKGFEFAILTNELYSSSFGLDADAYKSFKGLSKNDSLRDNMTPLELASVIFSEATSTELINETNPKSFVETKEAIHIAGNITREAITKLEEQTGKKVVTHENAKALDSPEIRKELAQQSSSIKLKGEDQNNDDSDTRSDIDSSED